MITEGTRKAMNISAPVRTKRRLACSGNGAQIEKELISLTPFVMKETVYPIKAVMVIIRVMINVVF